MIATGSKVYRAFCSTRGHYGVEIHEQEGDVVELKNEDKRFVRFAEHYMYPFDGSWFPTRSEALLKVAGELETNGHRLLEQAQELRTKAAEE